MRKYKNSDIAELAHQLTLAPRHLRRRQLEGVERLLGIVDPGNEYPYDLISFHITGRRPHKQNQKPSVLGEHLVSDLPALAEHITRKSSPLVSELGGEFKTHESVAEELGVSTKTIRRWRNRGLMGVRATCEDGVTRLMFSASAVSQFRTRNQAMVERGASFRLLTDAEKSDIVELARAMLAKKRRKLHIVARAVSAKTGRAVETVRYTLRQYDASHPDSALFSTNGEPAVSKEQRSIWRCHKRGESAEQIARTLGRSVTAVRAVLRELDVRRLKDEPIEYMDHELFHAPDARGLILDIPRPAAPVDRKKVRVPSDLPGYLRALYDIPLLSREQEADLFRRFNFLKFLAARALEAIEPCRVTDRQLDEVRGLLAASESIKNEIVQANLRLVVSIAKRHVGWSNGLFEVISDGNLSLMRAVDKFDVSLGNKFSTYASWAVMKNFARSVPEEHYHMRRFVTGSDEMLAATPDDRSEEMSAGEMESIRAALSDALGQLSSRERTIVSQHFGLFGKKTTATLEELGRRFGVTKERIRQIEKRAIDKLREVVSPTLLDAVSD